MQSNLSHLTNIIYSVMSVNPAKFFWYSKGMDNSIFSKMNSCALWGGELFTLKKILNYCCYFPILELIHSTYTINYLYYKLWLKFMGMGVLYIGQIHKPMSKWNHEDLGELQQDSKYWSDAVYTLSDTRHISYLELI